LYERDKDAPPDTWIERKMLRRYADGGGNVLREEEYREGSAFMCWEYAPNGNLVR